MHFYKNISRIGPNIWWTEYNDGKTSIFKKKIQPRLFVPSNKGSYVGINGEPLDVLHFEDTYEAANFQRMNKSRMKLFGTTNYICDFVAQEFPGKMQYDSTLINAAYVDIEVAKVKDGSWASPKRPYGLITAITMLLNGHYYALSYKDYIPDSNCTYIKCIDEKELLAKFFLLLKRKKVDVITGWNVEGFDIPYITERSYIILGKEQTIKLFSPFNKIDVYEQTVKIGETYRTVDIYQIHGISVIDYMIIYQKYGIDREKRPDNYKLDTVAYYELDEKKIDYSQYKSLDQLYEEDFKTFMDYNIKDTALVYKLEEKKNLLQLIFNLAYTAKVPLSEVLKQTRMWDSIIYNYLYDKGIIVPFKKEVDERKIEGAYVQEIEPKAFNYVMSYDIQSLYPNIMRSLNMGVETMEQKLSLTPDILLELGNIHSDYCKRNNATIAANGVTFSKKKSSFFYDLITEMFDERKHYKELQFQAKKKYEETKDPEQLKLVSRYKVLQETKKVCLNSLYGSLGQVGFRFFDPDLAEAVTLTGQYIIKYCAKMLDAKLQAVSPNKDGYVIAIDTDSNYLNMTPIIDTLKPEGNKIDFLDNYGKKELDPYVVEFLDKLATDLNFFNNHIVLIRDVIADRAIWTAKKRYIMNVHDVEGVRLKEPDIKVMGIEAIKSTTPEPCRKAFKEAFKLVMDPTKTEADIIAYVENFKKTFVTLSANDVASPKGCKGLTTYADSSNIYQPKGTPIHVRASLLYNHYIKKLKLDNKYEEIIEGDKIKYCYLKTPNPIYENVIAMKTSLPTEFGLDNYVDYELQFEKAFIEPLSKIIDTLGWSIVEKDVSIEDLLFS